MLGENECSTCRMWDWAAGFAMPLRNAPQLAELHRGQLRTATHVRAGPDATVALSRSTICPSATSSHADGTVLVVDDKSPQWPVPGAAPGCNVIGSRKGVRGAAMLLSMTLL